MHATIDLEAKRFSFYRYDEHGQKVEKAARQKGRTPKEHADLLVDNFKNSWVKLSISNDAFIRTTDAEHQKIVRDFCRSFTIKAR